MKVYGRITIYGEYLMHNNIQGLIMPSKLYLETTNKEINSTYNKKFDDVLYLINKKGIFPKKIIKGNLPLGYGLAGSTILSYLHLSNVNDLNLKKRMINKIDDKIHGFSPSGLDFESCLHQKWGLFCNSLGWSNLSFKPKLFYNLIIFPKENKKKLISIQEIILTEKTKLNYIQFKLNKKIDSENIIDLELLLEYSRILYTLNIYSEIVNEFIFEVLKKGHIAKGIGGLYDKAVIVIYKKASKEDYNTIKYLALQLGGKIIC